MSIMTIVLHIVSLQFMKFMARAQYSESGALIDSGTDLNMEGGLSEWVEVSILIQLWMVFIFCFAEINKISFAGTSKIS